MEIEFKGTQQIELADTFGIQGSSKSVWKWKRKWMELQRNKHRRTLGHRNHDKFT